jgi:membrane protein DedA with SNARE-associated domain
MLERLRQDIQDHAAKVLFIAKLTLGFSIPTLIATGLAKVPARRWFPWLALGETIWTGSLVLLGYHLGRYVQRLEKGIELIAIVGILLSLGFMIFYVGKLRNSGHKNDHTSSHNRGRKIEPKKNNELIFSNEDCLQGTKSRANVYERS